MLRTLLKDSAIYAIPALISRGLAFFLIPLYTRVLNPADYGSLDLMLIFANLVNLTVALEISQGVARFYTAEPDQKRRIQYASTSLWFTIACYTLFACVAFTGSGFVSKWVLGREGMEAVFQISLIYIWSNGLFCLIQNQFRWELRSKDYAVVSLLSTIGTAGVAVWLTVSLRWGLEGLLWGMAAGSFSGVLYGLWFLRRSFRFCFSFKRLWEMLRFSAPLVPSGIAVFVSTYIDRMMINYYLSVDELGLYGIGFRLASIAGLVMVGFQGALTPLIYTHYQDKETPWQLARVFRIFVALILLMFLFLASFAHDFLVIMTVPAYYGAAQVLVFLVPAVLLAQMYIFAPGISIAKKTSVILWINVAGAVCNTLLNWLLIPVMGIIGASLATMTGYVFIFCLYMMFSQRLYPVPHAWLPMAIAVGVILGLGLFVHFSAFDTLARMISGAVALLAAAITIYATGLITRSEVKVLLNSMLCLFKK
ncbi:oligosaccharide flippase family protein [Desulfobotulus sp. H1]|uniref:Oligosaccharide flippase family protein n=1 Tax=Desulfobotulus pelophilus TaxID=2823377 RepID=A0ABT3NCR8_9BACT|nr:oligosaccharide flippase family protein [Desulfobotulus pelophilus]MCW7755271.1 oligosaccharide flippase family protein [Desulfobotulus pelophilus]